MIRIVIGLMIVVLVIAACWCFTYEKRFVAKAAKAPAVVVDVIYSPREGQSTPFVEFIDETGAKIRCRAQSAGAFGVKTGQQVQILYTRKQTMGTTMSNVFILNQHGKAPLWGYTIGGVVMLIAAAMLVMVFLKFR